VIRHLALIDVLVVPLPGLVVIPQDADSLGDQRETILEAVLTAGKRARQPPDDDFDHDALRQPEPLAGDQLGLRVGVFTIIAEVMAICSTCGAIR
jgi:hypothetical protein